MIKRKKKVSGENITDIYNSRRTSLNVNLSYTSNTSSSLEDEANETSSMCEKNVYPNIARGNLSTKTNRSINNKADTTNNDRYDLSRIKPSFVKMVRISTSSAVTPKNTKLNVEDEISLERFISSENTKRSSLLKDVRFPLEGEIFSPASSIMMETSMDVTDVQGNAILNSEPSIYERFNLRHIAKDDDSFGVIQDTDDVEKGIERIGIIPDSEQDSINTVRTSMNVNTSLDSRFGSMPRKSLYDLRRSRDGQFFEDINEENEIEGILSHPVPESLDGNVAANCTIVTMAVVERKNSSNDRNYQEIIGDQTTINLESENNFHILHDTSLHDRMDSENEKSHSRRNCINQSSVYERKCTPKNHEQYIAANKENSNTEQNLSNIDLLHNSGSMETLLTNQDDRDLRLRFSNNEDKAIENIVPNEMGINPIPRRKKKLLTLRRSEMVDLSPVSVEIFPKKRIVPKKRCIKRNNKMAKKILNKEYDEARNNTEDSSLDNDLGETNPVPRKEKRIRKVKAKNIVIKKMADVDLWKRMNENANNLNESCDEISIALDRTSLDDFEPKNKVIRSKSFKKRPKIIIVATGLTIEQKILVKSIVTTLGSAKLDKIVTRNTTHVVSKGIRTVNLLRGIVRGCWLLSFEWISKSLEAGEWIDPDKYELTSFSKAVTENRKEKQLFGSAYVSELFLTCGLIHVEEKTSTPAQVLKELVRIAGGRVTKNPKDAKIIIGHGGLKEVWILDSITNGEIQPLELYCKKKSV